MIQQHFLTLLARLESSLDPSPQYNLPTPLTPFLGRECELAQLLALLCKPGVRLVTLTGSAGVGKTRLLTTLAQSLPHDFADKICFVSLGAISDPAYVVPTIAQTLGLRESGSRSSIQDVQAILGNQSYFLLLDNFEHVLPAAFSIAHLLTTCPHLRILVSSRAPLRLCGEYEFVVPPLALPDLKDSSQETFVQSPAFTLFVQRAQAIQPQLKVSKEAARPIAEICVRLDGLPLAIELAAALTRLLSPQALLSRLDHRLSILTDGARDAPARQQTLRATLAWSYQLLTAREQQLFRWLSVFIGGCQLSAIEAIAYAAGLTTGSVLQSLNGLLANHLVRQVEQAGEEPRLLMLETIREYGLECLEQCREKEETQAAHAAYFLTMTREGVQEEELSLWPSHFHAVMPHITEETFFQNRGMQQMELLECEQENLRAALSFLLERARTGSLEGAGEQALQLCIALSWFWHVRGSGQEGINFLMQALSFTAGKGTALRARALYVSAELAFIYDRRLPLEQLAQECFALYQELEDPVGQAYSLARQGGISRIRSQFTRAQTQLEDAATRFQALGNHWRQGQCWTELARTLTEQGHYEHAHTLLLQSLELYQELDDQQRLGWVRYLQARLLFVWQKDQAQAKQLAEQSLAHFREQGYTPYSVYPLGLLGLLHLEKGELTQARSLLEESLAIGKRAGVETDAADLMVGLAQTLALLGEVNTARCLYQEALDLLLECQVYYESVAATLESMATLEAEQGKQKNATRLWGAAFALRETIGAPIRPVQRASLEHAQAKARASLGMSAWRLAWEEGKCLRPEQALAMMQGQRILSPTLPTSQTTPSSKPSSLKLVTLTTRENEVLRWLAQGCTDAQIAEHLVISPRTVNHHTTSLYSKLGVRSRAAATRLALENHLI